MIDQPRQQWVVPSRSGMFRDLELQYLDPSDPDERRMLIEVEHPEYADALVADEVVVVDGEVVNPRLHIAMHEIVANQIWDLDPPETWATEQRLTALGYDRHEILHMIGRAVTTQLWRAMHEQEPFDRDAFVADLGALPGTREAQRSEPPRQPRRRTRRSSPRTGGHG